MIADQQLIFLISQPRAGSTLLQQILAGSPDVVTTPEPWVMLPLCYPLKRAGHWADYEAGGWARLAVNQFLGRIGGESTREAAIRQAGLTLYTEAMASASGTRFLDKTPRYYAIIPELARVFPQARFIILLRNPLAVLCSIVRTWVQDAWYRLPRYRHDLFDAPGLLQQGIDLLGERACVLRFEAMLQDPTRTVEGLCRQLDIAFTPEMLVYGDPKGPAADFGDPTGIHRATRPDASRGDEWLKDLRNPHVWRLASDYLTRLDAESTTLGYDAPAWRQLLK
ncbi:MAG: sulfotransferase, partial [Verrucomicrobia bacterium]|nr:sulfotransferase [Verrucomicrobiota bacterium]